MSTIALFSHVFLTKFLFLANLVKKTIVSMVLLMWLKSSRGCPWVHDHSGRHMMLVTWVSRGDLQSGTVPTSRASTLDLRSMKCWSTLSCRLPHAAASTSPTVVTSSTCTSTDCIHHTGKIVLDQGSRSGRPRYHAHGRWTPPLPLALAWSCRAPLRASVQLMTWQ